MRRSECRIHMLLVSLCYKLSNEPPDWTAIRVPKMLLSEGGMCNRGERISREIRGNVQIINVNKNLHVFQMTNTKRAKRDKEAEEKAHYNFGSSPAADPVS